jgi:PAS domain S-box-containing protein
MRIFRTVDSNESDVRNFFTSYTDAVVSNIRLAILDTTCNVVWVNEAFCEITQYKADELIGKPLGDTNLIWMAEGDFKTIHHHLSKGYAWSGEIKTRTKEGLFIWLRTNILPIRDKNEKLLSYLILISDVTSTRVALEEKKEMMETLTRSEARYQALVNNQPDLMSLCDKNGIRIFVNEKYCGFMGKPQHELIGTSIREITLGGVSLDIIDQVFKMTPDDHEVSGVLELQNSKGERVWMSLSVRGIFDDEGNLFEILTTGRDVTILKKAELGLSKYVEDLERIAFLTSHKVRAPIATMLGLLELLRLNAISSHQWNTVFTSFYKCICDLDLYSRELDAFINQRQTYKSEAG